MTRKDYVLIAAALRNAQFETGAEANQAEVFAVVKREICAALRLDNAKFDSRRFMEACDL